MSRERSTHLSEELQEVVDVGGAHGHIAPLKFAEGGLSPPYVMAL